MSKFYHIKNLQSTKTYGVTAAKFHGVLSH